MKRGAASFLTNQLISCFIPFPFPVPVPLPVNPRRLAQIESDVHPQMQNHPVDSPTFNPVKYNVKIHKCIDFPNAMHYNPPVHAFIRTRSLKMQEIRTHLAPGRRHCVYFPRLTAATAEGCSKQAVSKSSQKWFSTSSNVPKHLHPHCSPSAALLYSPMSMM